MSLHESWLGGLCFDRDGGADYGTFRLTAYATDADFDDPDERVVELPSLLGSGSREVVTGRENRTIFFRVEALSLTGNEVGLSDAEAALLGVVGPRSEYMRVPPLTGGEPTVWDVERSSLAWLFDDLGELGAGGTPKRVFGLRMVCYPDGRAVEPVVVPAVTTGTGSGTPDPVVTTVWGGASGIAGWSAYPGPALAVGGTVSTQAASSISFGSLTYAPDFSLSGTPWISVRCGGLLSSPPLLFVNGVNCGTSDVVTADYWHHWYVPGVTTVTEMSLLCGLPKGGVLWASKITRQDRAPRVGTAKQMARAFDVYGTAGTHGAIHVGHSSTGLGEVLLWCGKEDGSGYQPPMRTHRVSGGTVTLDTAMRSGARTRVTPGTPEVYEVPVAQIPRGLYSVVARLAPVAAGQITITQAVATKHDGFDLGGQIAFDTRTYSTAGAYQMVTLPGVDLPTVRLSEGSAAKVKLTLSVSAAIDLDEVWLLNTTTGDVVRFNAGSLYRHAWIDPPTIDVPVPTIWIGAGSDRSAAMHVDQTSIRSWTSEGVRLAPGRANAFVSVDAEDAAVDAAYWRRYRHNAAPIPAPIEPTP